MLSDVERREAAVEIIRRMTLADGELPESVLLEAADALFCMLDAEEAANVGPWPRRGLDCGSSASRASHEPSSGYGERPVTV
jgi:hypothetical protein